MGLGPRKPYNSKKFAKSKVKVTEKVIKCKKIKCHNFDSKVNGKNPMWLRHTLTKIFAKNHSVKLVNAL